MSWVKYIPKRCGTNRLTVTKSNITLNKKLHESMGFNRVSVFYDTELKKIKLVEDENGAKLLVYPRQVFIPVKLSGVMPMGRYFFNDGEFVFGDSLEPLTGATGGGE